MITPPLSISARPLFTRIVPISVTSDLLAAAAGTTLDRHSAASA
jgi:hypothetical protein